MANMGSIFNKFLSLFILLVHLGCFIFPAKDQHRPPAKKRTVFPLSRTSSCRSSGLKPAREVLSSAWSAIKRMFSRSRSCKTSSHEAGSPTPTLTSARSSQLSIVSCTVTQPSGESDILNGEQVFPLRNDIIFPCTACGEIFQNSQLLQQHQAIKHSVSELLDGDSGKNIVHIIFNTGWSCKEKRPQVHRILKIHSSPKVLSRFEEHREFVKSKAARNAAVKRRDERCLADGNELLRFYCSTFICDLGRNGNSSICHQQHCSICGIIKSGFSPKLDGISTFSTSWRAHMAIPEDIEEEFEFMNVKRAMLVCRVVAGRVGCELDEDIDEKVQGGIDSAVGRRGSGVLAGLDEEELLVYNPRAVLPCFVIVYTV